MLSTIRAGSNAARLRAGFLLVAGSLLSSFTLGPTAAAQEDPGSHPWPMAGRDATHSGAADGPAPPYREAWRVPVALGGPASGPVVADGAVVIVAEKGVMALEPETGEVIWEVPRVEGPAGPPAAAGDVVVHATGSGSGAALVARQIDDGREVWRIFTGSAPAGGPTAAGDAIFAGTRDGSVLALDAASGEERWRYDTRGVVDAAPAVAGGLVLAVSEDTATGQATMLALDAEQGAEDDAPVWQFAPQGAASSPAAPVAVAGDTAVLASSDATVRGFGLNAGNERWSAELRDLVLAAQVPAAPAPDAVVVADRLHLVRLDSVTGDHDWTYRLADFRELDADRLNTLMASSPAVAGGTVVIGDASGLLSAVDLESGHRVWRMDVGTGPVGSVAADGDRLYLATQRQGGSVIALENDPQGRLIDEVSPTVLFPVRAVLNYAVALVAVAAAILLLFRVALRARPPKEREPAEADPS
jgi:outer membrane protein assembly factor BamB